MDLADEDVTKREVITRTFALVRTIVRPYDWDEPISSRKIAVSQFYAADCTFTHPLFRLRAAVARMFALWALANLELRPTISRIYLDPRENGSAEVFIDFVQSFQLLSLFMLFGPYEFRMGVRLLWRNSEAEGWRIVEHEDRYWWDSVINMATFGLYSRLVFPVLSRLTQLLLSAFAIIVGRKDGEDQARWQKRSRRSLVNPSSRAA